MCEECGCQETIKIDRSITDINDAIAIQNNTILTKKGILCINLMGSPGSGKTTIIENLSSFIPAKDIAIIQGDLESDVDKNRLEKQNIDTFQINTHSGCHLNASMINQALMDINLVGKKYLVIENVGNLVCPAGVKIGQHLNVLVSSTTEGSDKPKKYPPIFRDSNLIIISKKDIAQAVDFDEQQYTTDIKNINPKVKIIKTSKKEKDSFKELAHFLEHEHDHLTGHHHSH